MTKIIILSVFRLSEMTLTIKVHNFNYLLINKIFLQIVRALREEIAALQESGSYVGEVVRQMDKDKVLVKVITVVPA